MSDAPQTVTIGEVEFTQAQASQLIDLFSQPGWKHFVSILENHKAVELSTVFGKTENTHAQYALSHGIYGMITTMLEWPYEATTAYRETFSQK